MPLGRTEVVAAVLETAADLFAERGPAATSIRDIAARSRVNHGLIHRHFGSKDALVGAVLDHLGQHLAGLLDAKADGSAIGDSGRPSNAGDRSHVTGRVFDR